MTPITDLQDEHALPFRRVPEGEFVTEMDRLLGKREPDNSIPWPMTPVPDWISSRQPCVLLDIGTGVGGFLGAVLTRLAVWGKTQNLQSLIWAEGDETLHPEGAQGLKAALSGIFSQCLEGNALIEMIGITENLTIKFEDGAFLIPQLEPIGKKADLVILSHVTYYFGDGSGRDLLQAIRDRYLSEDGIIWCVIRKRDCPIYRMRQHTLSQMGITETKPYDYAEYFQTTVLPALKGLHLIDCRDQDYLCSPQMEGRLEAAYGLMWREPPNLAGDSTYSQAVLSLKGVTDALFDERHFILGGN